MLVSFSGGGTLELGGDGREVAVVFREGERRMRTTMTAEEACALAGALLAASVGAAAKPEIVFRCVSSIGNLYTHFRTVVHLLAGGPNGSRPV